MYVYLAIALLSAALSGAGAWKVQSWRHAAELAEQAELQREKDRMDRKTIDGAAVGHEKDKTEIRTVIRTVNKEVARVVEKPVYRNVCLDDDGLRAIASAINGTASASVTPGAVPEPKPAK